LKSQQTVTRTVLHRISFFPLLRNFLDQNQQTVPAVTAEPNVQQTMAPNMPAAPIKPPPAMVMLPPPHPRQLPQVVQLGNQSIFRHQMPAYQSGLMGVHPQFLHQQLIPNAIFPNFPFLTTNTVTGTNFQSLNLSSTVRSTGTGVAAPQETISAQEAAQLSGTEPQSLYMSCDDDSLSEYQCLVRQQIELFEALPEDVTSNAKGRNKPIVIGQVGIRCRHCRLLPPKSRHRGATYYPAKLKGLYQAAQSMASGHLCNHCGHIPHSIRQELLVLRERKSSAGGGKKYWADGVLVLGVYEDKNGLRFRKEEK
jgi:hypothetical protein